MADTANSYSAPKLTARGSGIHSGSHITTLAGEGRVLSTWSDGMRQVIDALAHLDSATTAEIAAHPDVDVGRRQVLDHLETLRDRGVLTRQQDPVDGRRYLWQDDGLHRVNDHGNVDLYPVDLDDLTEAEVAEVARSSPTYTWEFRNFASDSATAEANQPHRAAADGGTPARPPDGDDLDGPPLDSPARWWCSPTATSGGSGPTAPAG